MRDHAPDLLLFQLSNPGRRPFLKDAPYERFFREDPSLYRENLRYCWPEKLNFLGRWRLFRAAVIALNRRSALRGLAAYEAELVRGAPRDAMRPFEDFCRGVEGAVPVVLVRTVHGDCADDTMRALGLPAVRLDLEIAKKKDPAYARIHPPGYVYGWYARELAAGLEKLGLLGGG